MSRLTDAVLAATLHAVDVVRVDGDAVRYWNARKRPSEPVMLAGWYWLQGPRESGPFPNRSAAIRDAYYRVVLRTEPPGASDAAARSDRAAAEVRPAYRPVSVLRDAGKKRGVGRPRRDEYFGGSDHGSRRFS